MVVCLASNGFTDAETGDKRAISEGPLSVVIQAVKPMFADSDIGKAVRVLETSGSKIDTDSLIEAVYELRRAEICPRPADEQIPTAGAGQRPADPSPTGPSPGSPGPSSTSPSPGSPGPSSTGPSPGSPGPTSPTPTSDDDDEQDACSESETEELSADQLAERAKMVYRQRIRSLSILCQSCRRRRANVLLLPCAHLASCKGCLDDIRRCPVSRCKKIIRGTKEVFFVG